MGEQLSKKYEAALGEQLAAKFLTRSPYVEVDWTRSGSGRAAAPSGVPSLDLACFVTDLKGHRLPFGVEVKATSATRVDIKRAGDSVVLSPRWSRRLAPMLEAITDLDFPVMLMLVLLQHEQGYMTWFSKHLRNQLHHSGATAIILEPVGPKTLDAIPKYMVHYFRGHFRPRTMQSVVCSECGLATEVPFKPVPGRPVYCKACYSSRV